VSVLENTLIAGTGFELLVLFRGKTYVLTKAGDNFGQSGSVNSPLDPQLQLLIEHWPTLSKEVQQQIMLLVG
jgi:hypothetical protein